MMMILIACDKFKGSLSAKEVCHHLAFGIEQKNADVKIVEHPMADGGDGTLEILQDHLQLEIVYHQVQDPVGNQIEAYYYLEGNKAFIELAVASGIVLVPKDKRNPKLCNTIGTGELIKHAIENEADEIFLFLGGSSTNDGGVGIANALGYRFLDSNGNEIVPIGENLTTIDTIDIQNVIDHSNVQFTLMCDVTNPLFGPNGAAYTFGAQKGASSDDINDLDLGLRKLTKVLMRIDDSFNPNSEGFGAAGGIAACLTVLCKAKLESGFSFVNRITDLESRIQQADLVITGEGQIDESSFQGKVVEGVKVLCDKYQKKMIVVAGRSTLDEVIEDLTIYTTRSLVESDKESMKQAKGLLEVIGKQIIADILYHTNYSIRLLR